MIIAGRGLASASVAISPAPHRGVLPLPIAALRSSSPVLRNPANRNRAVLLTYQQFRYAFANAIGEDEAKQLYETYAVPGSGAMIFQAATANLNPSTEAKVDSRNPDRGPLSSRSPIGGTRSRSTAAGARSPTRRWRSSSDSSRSPSCAASARAHRFGAACESAAHRPSGHTRVA